MPGTAAVDEDATSGIPSRANRRFPLRMSLLLAGAWLAFLLFLTLTSANPITLNRSQILDADLVVIAKVLDPAAGRCELIESLNGPAIGTSFAVRRLDASGAQVDGLYLIPLSMDVPLRYDITPTPDGSRLIYPAVPEALSQFREITGR